MINKGLTNIIHEMNKLNEKDLKKLFDILCDKIDYKVEEKTLDDFTMEEVLEYAKAYKGIPLKMEKGKIKKRQNEPLVVYGAKKFADITYEDLKKFINMKVEYKSDLLDDLVSVSSSEALKKSYKYLMPTEDWLKHLYNTRNNIKLNGDSLAYLMRNSFDSKFRSALIKVFEDGNLNYFASVARDKNNVITPSFSNIIVKRTYINLDYDNAAEPFNKLIDMLVGYLNKSLKVSSARDYIHSLFKHDPSTDNKTTLEKIADVIGVDKVLTLLDDIGFNKPSIDMIKSKTFVCNLMSKSVQVKNIHENIMISSSYGIVLNELLSFKIQGYKIFDIYSNFMDHILNIMPKLSPEDQFSIIGAFVDTNIFGAFNIYSLFSSKRDRLTKCYPDLAETLAKVRKHNMKLPKNPNLFVKKKNNNTNIKEIKLSHIKWTVRSYSYVVKNPQTTVYYLLRLGITNKQLQQLAECSSMDVILAAKDNKHWLNDSNNWKRGSMKDLCLLCMKKGVSYRRLDQILCCGGNKIYQYYNQILKDDPSVVSHLEIIK